MILSDVLTLSVSQQVMTSQISHTYNI